MRIVIADDHRLVTEALAEYLSRLDPNIDVLQASTLAETVAIMTDTDQIDLVLLDFSMPGMHGLTGLTEIRDRFEDIPIVMISGVADHPVIAEALHRGAAGFIPKDLTGRAMLKALELVLAGERYVPASFVTDGSFTRPSFGPAGGKHWEAGNPLGNLTKREAEVLTLAIEGQSNKQIARELGLQAATAAFHIKGICKKLGAANRTEAVAKAIRLGI